MTRKAVVAVLALAAVSFNVAWVRAQDAALAELYGQGVHAYFAGDARQAHELLSAAIEEGTRDPRAYYFRGLAYKRLGRPDEARADFQKGAELEISRGSRVYPVARSLQRIQGRTRLELERHRRSARVTAMAQDRRAQQARYEELKRAEEEVVRSPDRPPRARPSDVVEQPEGEDSSDPFAGEPEEPQPAPEEPEAAESPEPTPQETAEEEEPSSDADDEGEEPAEEPVDDPFADDDPFGGDPFGSDSEDEDDPFSGDDDDGDDESGEDDSFDDPFADDAFGG